MDVRKKVDHKTTLREHIKFHCSLGRWSFGLLGRIKKLRSYIFVWTALESFIYLVSQSVNRS